MKAISVISFIFIANCLLCWMLTSEHWILGPLLNIVAFMGGILLISLLGFLSIEDRSV